MKIQFASDLHLEFPENKDFIRYNPLTVAGEILVLAGDIALLNSLDQHKDFVDAKWSQNYQTVFKILIFLV
jgi:Icc-related predicted phosphoesterase